MNPHERLNTTAAEVSSAPHIRLPTSFTPFVARDAECTQLLERLAEPACRLMTITGPGGSGKTRLAIEVVRRLSESSGAARFRDGIFFISLAELASVEPFTDVFANTIASELGLLFDGSDAPSVQLRRMLRDRKLLLILDNIEHLRASTALIDELLQGALQLTILATSHATLGLRGEWVIPLNGLLVPGAETLPHGSWEQYGALKLFTQVAHMVAPDFLLNEQTLPAVVQICRLVDGLPLGIELAAGWLNVLSCTEIAAEITQSFDFLSSEAHNRAARQRSLRAVFAYSWALLTPPEQQALRQLAIFSGSFTRDAAAVVAGAPLACLASLVNKSLVRRVGGAPAVGAVRYELSQPLRQYAMEELIRADELESVTVRHTAYYAEYLAARTAGLRGSQQRTFLAEIDQELDGIRAAWRWAIETCDYAAIGAAAPSLFHFYDMRSRFQEGAAMFAAASRVLLAHRTERAAGLVWGAVLARHAWFIFYLGRLHEARELFEESLALLRGLSESSALIFPLNYLGAIWSYLGEYAETERLCNESLMLTQAGGDDYGRAVASNILGQAAYDRGDYRTAQYWHEQSMAIEERIGNQWSLAFSLTNLGKVALRMDRAVEASALFERSLHIRREFGDLRGMSICHHRLGEAAIARSDPAAAAAHYLQSLHLAQSIANRWGVTNALIQLGLLAVRQQRDAVAARLFREALAQALETAAIPQQRSIFDASIEILLRQEAAGLLDEQARLLAGVSFDSGIAPEDIDRLADWLAAAGQELTLEQAIDAVQAPPPTPTPVPNARASGLPPAVEPGKLPGGLTPREIDVLRLVARGLTDAQIAEQLVVSRRTVNTHLTSIYGKLQVTSRSAATRFALEHGLL